MTTRLFLNWPILLPVIFLIAVGILVIFSTSPQLALLQAIFALFGFILYFFISQLDYKTVKGLVKPLFFILLILLILVAVLGIETRGTVRWIPLGPFNIQPSELAKPILILFLAHFWSTRLPTFKNILISLLWILLPVILILKQPGLGSALTIFIIWLFLLFAARIELKKFLSIIIVIALLVPVGWTGLYDYQKQRILSFLSPSTDPLGHGYNLIQSTIAVGSGQLFGMGLGHGTQSRLQFLPEYRTDFIFASIAEEFGFLGSVVLLGIYFFLITYCFKIALSTTEPFGFLIAVGASSMISFQTIVNAGMNVGILPITGITLPLVSYGGSSVLAVMVTLGLVSSVAKFKSHNDFEDDY